MELFVTKMTFLPLYLHSFPGREVVLVSTGQLWRLRLEIEVGDERGDSSHSPFALRRFRVSGTPSKTMSPDHRTPSQSKRKA